MGGSEGKVPSNVDECQDIKQMACHYVIDLADFMMGCLLEYIWGFFFLSLQVFLTFRTVAAVNVSLCETTTLKQDL